MDDDLTAILNELDADQAPVKPLFPGTTIYVPDLLPKFKPATDVKSRIERLYDTVSQLPKKLYRGFLEGLADVQEAIPDEPDHRLVVGGHGAGDALRAHASYSTAGCSSRSGCSSAGSGTSPGAPSTTRST